MVAWPSNESNNGNNSDPTPTTVTVVEILFDLSTSSPSLSPSTTSQSNSLTSMLLKTTTTFITTSTIDPPQTSPSQISTPAPTSTSSRSLTSSVSRSSSTLSPHPTSSEAPLSQNSKTFSTSSLNSGAIAGIVLACIFIFLIGAFFAFRTWSKRNRAKQNKIWSRSMMDKRYGNDAPELSYETKLASGLPLSGQTTSPQVSVPPISYNSDAVFQYSTIPSPSAFTSPVYSPGLMSLSPYSTTVVCAFIPSLPDELTISIGETLSVLAGYEDGWSLCMNRRGKQGMVPNECLEDSFSSMGLLLPPPSGDYRNSKSSARVSSLGQAVGYGR